MPAPLLVPAIATAATWLFRGLVVRKVASAIGEKAWRVAVLFLLGKIVISVMLSPFVHFLAKLAARVALLFWIYKWCTEWLLYRAWDVFNGAMQMIPDFGTSALLRMYQVILVTEAFIPWDDAMICVKWLVVVKLWLIMWHGMDWVLNFSMKTLRFFLGA